MAVEFLMPSLGPDMESGTLVEWRVKPGDVVKRGNVIALVETSKGVIDVEVFTDGTVLKLLVEPGTTVPVGAPLAELSGTATEAPPRSEGPAATPAPAAAALHAETREAAHPVRPGFKASPAARAKALALGIALEGLTGSGPDGAITLDDVARQAASVTAPPTLRDVVAKAMSRSKREIPHYYLSLTCDFTASQAWLERHNAAASVVERILPAALFVAAVAKAARALPGFNGYYGDRGFTQAEAVHVGMAIALRGGRLVAPALLDADRKTAPTLMAELRDLTARVRSGHMRGSEMSQATITVTSLGEEGVDVVLPVIHPPQVAIVGVGSIVVRPWVVGGVVSAAPVVTLSLAADHRVTDGRTGARFLAHIRDALQTPETL
ncbi:MAG: dihydrolipoamide acetyltransferase family protein [Steroidobacteraceae bacterium]